MADWPRMPPQRILLASDLSSRGDRALDRAAQLAQQWGAELLILHAVEGEGLASPEHQGLPSWRRPPNTHALVEQQIREDVRWERPLKVLVEEGPAARAIVAAAEREQCDLVVVGLGRSRVFAWPPLGKTIDELFRRCPTSLLVVKKRPRAPYAHLLVGVDFTPEAKAGLEAAGQLFPDASVTAMNAFDMPYRTLLPDSQLGRDFGEMERATLDAFTQDARLPPAFRGRLRTLIEHGPPEAMLSAYVMEQGADLTVVGAYGRGRIFHTLVGGNGPRIVEATPSDILVVRAQRDAASDRAV